MVGYTLHLWQWNNVHKFVLQKKKREAKQSTEIIIIKVKKEFQSDYRFIFFRSA